MIVTRLPTHDGIGTIEVGCNQISFWGIIRCLRKFNETAVSEAARDPMNDNAKAKIRFKGHSFSLYTPFSDYLISNDDSDCPSEIFEELFLYLQRYRVRWWEKLP
jgi:hypothetical protein